MSNATHRDFIVVVNHDRRECGVATLLCEGRAMREIGNCQTAGRNIDGFAAAFSSREAAEAAARTRHGEYHFLGDCSDVLKMMESDPLSRQRSEDPSIVAFREG